MECPFCNKLMEKGIINGDAMSSVRFNGEKNILF